MALLSSHLQFLTYLTYSPGHIEEMQNKHLRGFMPLIHPLWDLGNYVVDCGNIAAVAVVDEMPAMAAKMAMLDRSTQYMFLAVSAIKQKDLSSALGGALQHANIMAVNV